MTKLSWLVCATSKVTPVLCFVMKFQPVISSPAAGENSRHRLLATSLHNCVKVSENIILIQFNFNAAAQEAETCIVLSCMASATIEDVAKAAPDVLRWLQMYIFRDQGLTRSLIKRAEDNGYKAIVLTVDAIIHGRRRNDLRNQFILVPHLRFGNVGGPTNKADSEDYAMYVKSLIEQAIDWSTVSWLKSVTKLPVLLKGILTAEDARIAVKHGVDGIIVSNHGGRQLDGVPATVRYYTTPYILIQLITRFGGWTPIRGRVLELCCIDLKSYNSMQNS